MSATGRSAIATLKKFNIKPNKSVRARKAVAERAADIVKEAVAKDVAKGPSRNDLMLQAKAKGIKNFRILNKDELAFVLCEGQSKENIDAAVKIAVERWHSGFGTRKVKDDSKTV